MNGLMALIIIFGGPSTGPYKHDRGIMAASISDFFMLAKRLFEEL